MAQLARILWSIVALLLFVSAGFFARYKGVAGLEEAFLPRTKLVVTATIEAGSTFDVYANGNFNERYFQPIEPNTKVEYTFIGLPTRISFLRLDPGDAPG